MRKNSRDFLYNRYAEYNVRLPHLITHYAESEIVPIMCLKQCINFRSHLVHNEGTSEN